MKSSRLGVMQSPSFKIKIRYYLLAKILTTNNSIKSVSQIPTPVFKIVTSIMLTSSNNFLVGLSIESPLKTCD